MLSNALSEGRLASEEREHLPVMLTKVVEFLRPDRCERLVDATLGSGGHAEALLARLGPSGKLYGIDRDESALEYAHRRLQRFSAAFTPLHGRHEELIDLLRNAGVFAIDGIVADLGISSLQLDDPERGFSFSEDGPLDMRMDRSAGRTAAELLAAEPERRLREIISRYGEEKMAGPIAKAIVRQRASRPLTGTTELADLVVRTLGARAKRYRIHPATRTFQAIRIAVNNEIEGLEKFLSDAVSMLRKGGRLAVISFHSLEDRAVKQTMRAMANRCTCPPSMPVCGCGRENIVRILTTRPARPLQEEIGANPRSRSAKLRVVERI